MTMTLEQLRDWHMNCAVVYEQSGEFALADQHRNLANLAAAITAHLPQPARSVDVEAIREVIEDMECSSLSEKWTQPNRWAERLTAALQEGEG